MDDVEVEYNTTSSLWWRDKYNIDDAMIVALDNNQIKLNYYVGNYSTAYFRIRLYKIDKNTGERVYTDYSTVTAVDF